jgi:hypothetical protein
MFLRKAMDALVLPCSSKRGGPCVSRDLHVLLVWAYDHSRREWKTLAKKRSPGPESPNMPRLCSRKETDAFLSADGQWIVPPWLPREKVSFGLRCFLLKYYGMMHTVKCCMGSLTLTVATTSPASHDTCPSNMISIIRFMS